MSDKHHNPQPHQSPVHDDREAKPGLDALAPEDQNWRPTPHPTAPGEEPTAPGSMKAPDTHSEKLDALEKQRKGGEDFALTTNQGVRIADDQNSLRAGKRGPTLLEDFILREKITHFDHERIPERIVHARGSAAHGYFQAYSDLSDITKADFLCSPEKKTPVFVRFSTVQGGAGSADTVRDIRGFATKFYTDEGF
jgi:catalase